MGILSDECISFGTRGPGLTGFLHQLIKKERKDEEKHYGNRRNLISAGIGFSSRRMDGE
jgi:hypothetical protein